MSLLKNYIKLKPEEKVCMRLENPRIEERIVHDPKSGRITIKRALVFDVTEVNGEPIHSQFSTLSEKLATTLYSLWESGELKNKRVCIIWHPRDFATEYEVWTE